MTKHKAMMRRLQDYIEIVVRDSMLSENRTGIVQAQFAILDDVVYLDIRTRYRRVRRRAAYRLAGHFRKNTGLGIVLSERDASRLVKSEDDAPDTALVPMAVAPRRAVDGRGIAASCRLNGREMAVVMRDDEIGNWEAAKEINDGLLKTSARMFVRISVE